MMTRRQCVLGLLAGQVVDDRGGLLFGAESARPRLAHSFEDERLMALSSDGKVLVLYSSQTPIELYRLPASGKSERVGSKSGGKLRAIETESRKQIQSLDLSSYPSGAAFFPKGQQLMFWYSPADGPAVVIWDTTAGRISDVARGNDAEGVWHVTAITSEFAVASAGRNDQIHLVKLALPTGEVIGKRRLKGIGAREMCFSDDRRLVACLTHGKDSELVILQTSNLDVVDKVSIPINGRIWKIAFAGRDKLIVGVTIRSAAAEGRWPSVAYVHSIGKEGLGARFPVTGLTAFAVSSDSTLLAVGSSETRRVLFGEEGQATATLYNLRDGTLAGRAVHPWHREKRDNPFVNRLDKIEFSQDGKWMFTSTGRFETLMWAVQG